MGVGWGKIDLGKLEHDPIFKVGNCQIVFTTEAVDLREERLASAFAQVQPDRSGGNVQCPLFTSSGALPWPFSIRRERPR